MNLLKIKIINLLNLIMRDKKIKCYPYCLGLKYDREIGITEDQWEKNDINVIVKLLLQDLEKLKISYKVVDKKYILAANEKLLALRIGVMWLHYFCYLDYHVIVKKQDGYWYSKFGQLDPEKLPLNTDIELWNWRDSNNIVKENHYKGEIAYIAIQC